MEQQNAENDIEESDSNEDEIWTEISVQEEDINLNFVEDEYELDYFDLSDLQETLREHFGEKQETIQTFKDLVS
jgi:hypothetical protein